MKYIVLFCSIFFIINTHSLVAKKWVSTSPHDHYITTRKAQASFEKKALPPLKNAQSAVVLFLKKEIPNLQAPDVSLKLSYKMNSHLGTHYTFTQLFKNIPIYGTQIKVWVHEGEVVSVIENTYDFTKASIQSEIARMQHFEADDIATPFIQKNNFECTESAQKVWFFEAENTPRLGVYFEAQTADFSLHRDFILAPDGRMLYDKDLFSYFHPVEEEALVTATAYVFLPDPITTAQTEYAAPGFTDADDGDSPELTAERVAVDITVTLEDGVYSLEDDHAIIRQFSAPVIEPTTATEAVFDFTRSQNGFEDVNAFYHIQAYYNYVVSLDPTFASLFTQKVQIDTHALNGDDQSRHSCSSGLHRLFFGEGGVDDAEDADVVIHEYGHALSCAASPGSNSGSERLSIDEGLGDYFAVSYSRHLSEYNWGNMFSWDGHNQFFSGRDIDNDKTYAFLSNDLYGDSEILSATLMEIWGDLGRETTDALVIGSLRNLAVNMTMPQFATVMLITDQILFDSANQETLTFYFCKRGLLSCNVDAGTPTTLCLGETYQLGSDANVELPDATVSWTPRINVDDPTAWQPIANPDASTMFVMTVTDFATQQMFTDSVFIEVDFCFDTEAPEAVRIINTDRFFQGRGLIFVEFPEDTETVRIEIFNIAGQIVRHISHDSNERLQIDSQNLQSGIYFMRVVTNGTQKDTFTLGRVR